MKTLSLKKDIQTQNSIWTAWNYQLIQGWKEQPAEDLKKKHSSIGVLMKLTNFIGSLLFVLASFC